MILSELIQQRYQKSIGDCSEREIYRALWEMILSAVPKASQNGFKKLYYLSAEFLVGKQLGENLRRLGLYEAVDAELSRNGRSLAAIEGMEPEPALGNGGLGRLAACFLDSIADLCLPGVGVGLLYHFGLFRQVFANGKQTERPDPWLGEEGAIVRTDTVYPVNFPFGTVYARRYELPVLGEDGGATGTNGVLEKDLNLAVSGMLSDLLRGAGYTVVETRTEDRLLYTEGTQKGRKKQGDLENRVKYTALYPNSILVSIHMNTFLLDTCEGVQVWYSQNDERSAALAKQIQDGVREHLQPSNNRKIKAATSSIYLLRHAKTPAVLVECGFLSNPSECARLCDTSYQQKLALTLFDAICENLSNCT